jgi:hypothetical protein
MSKIGGTMMGISSFTLSGAYIEDGYNAKAWTKHASHNICCVATQLNLVRKQSRIEPQSQVMQVMHYRLRS